MHTGFVRRALDQMRLAEGGLTDGQLLTRFLDGRDDAAFTALVRRHGAMVLGVCRRLLGHADDAEDAFQATFLILARKGASVGKREAVSSFLYGVAYRVALRARARANRRGAIERQVADMPHPAVMPPETEDWRPVLDRELNCLPEKYKAVLVVCDLECKPRREAARQLGLLEGTLASRLATARRMLAKRLTKCGLALSGGALATAITDTAEAAVVPATLVKATVKAATLVAAGQAAAVATPAVHLMNEVLKAMLMTKLKFHVAGAMLAVLLSAIGFAYQQATAQAPPPQSGDRPLTDVESLRREVEILKLQMKVVQLQIQAQDAELRALSKSARSPAKGPGGMGFGGGGGIAGGGGGMMGITPSGGGGIMGIAGGGGGIMGMPGGGGGIMGMPGGGGGIMGMPGGGGGILGGGPPADKPREVGDRRVKTPAKGAILFDPLKAAAAADKAFRESKDPKLRQEATDALNGLVRFWQKLRASEMPSDEPKRP
jgi:RNA polymerase sigma factor (sigma-70 family)